MTIEQLQTLIDSGNVEQIKSAFETSSTITDLTKCLNEYEIKKHKVNDITVRKDKVITDQEGNFKDRVPVARLPIPIQKNIVMVAAAFLGVPEISATPENPIEQNFITIIKKVLEDNKFDYLFMSCVKKCKSEKQSAILLYTEDLKEKRSLLDLLKPKVKNNYWAGFPINKNTNQRIRMKKLAPSLGDKLYPVFDPSDNMIAFGRFYEVSKGEKATQYFDVYTADKFYFSSNESGSWVTNTYTNIIGKIPVIYFSQPLTDWDDVQALIERLETKISNHADTNDYYDSPIVKAKGEVEGFSDKGEAGKVLKMSEGADASYMTYDSLPESMKMEMDNLWKMILSMTHTPDISFENLKNLGYYSKVALQTMFMDAHMKAYDSEEIFGEGAQRLYNYLKVAISVIAPEFVPALTLQLKPKFNYFLPKNEQDEITTLVAAKTAGLISTKTAIALNPLVEDIDSEIKQIEKEAKENPTSKPGVLQKPVPPVPNDTMPAWARLFTESIKTLSEKLTSIEGKINKQNKKASIPPAQN